MLKSILALFAFAFAVQTQAAPPQAVLDLIRKTYNPQISAKEKDITTFIDLCRRVEVEITAQDPVTLKPGKVKLTTFVRKFSEDQQSQLKTVIVMPPTGGVNILDWAYAARLCVSNFRVAVITNWDFDTLNELDMNMHDRGALRALAAVRHGIEYLKPQHANQLGILGTSVGAITAAFATGYDVRISAAALIVGGAGMSEIIGKSDESHLKKLREDRMAQLQMRSVDEYQKALAEHIKIEPLDFANYSGKKNVWMMIATKDTTVPTENQWKLFRALGSPSSLMYDNNHVETIKYTAFARTSAIVNFFEQNLR